MSARILIAEKGAAKHHVVISDDGTIRFIYADDLSALLGEGVAKVERASHVEPTEDGRWSVDMRPIGGPVLPITFEKRADALQAEVNWLRENEGL